MKKAITEEMGIHKEWYETAKKIKTSEELKRFVESLIKDYRHDYGTIVHAICAAMLATFTVIDSSEQGGITGFQAAYISWKIIEELVGVKPPCRLLEFRYMLYPYEEYKFTTLSPEIWKYLQKEARKMIEDPEVSENIRKHCQSILEGKVPFGWKVEEVRKDEQRI